MTIESAAQVVYSDGYVTEGNLVRPDLPPPTCGWPLVVFVHRLGESRADELMFQQAIAAQGYAVWAYDVRGQGGAQLLNAPGIGTTMYGGAEKYDFAEQVAFVRQEYPLDVSPDKIAVLGFSQGGVHAWFAAAYSGRTLSLPGRGTINFPVITTAVPMDFIAEPTEHRLRGGTLFSNWLMTLVGDDTRLPFVLDEDFRDDVRDSVLSGDRDALLRHWQAEPGRMIDDLLATTTVPLLFSHAYHDFICSPLPALRTLRSLPSATTWRAVQSTVGHNTPVNTFERAFLEELVLRWLHRFLWNENNEVDVEGRMVRALMPLDRTEREDPASLWGRVLESDGTTHYPIRQLYLHGDGTLAEVAPHGRVQTSIIDHSPHIEFTPEHYLRRERNRAAAGVLQLVPLSERVFAAAPLVDAAQLGPGGRVSLWTSTENGTLCIAALLTVQEPGGDEVMLSSWGRGVLDAALEEPFRLDIDLPGTGTVLTAGTVIRLRLRNLWLREFPMAHQLEVTPLFEPYRATVFHGSGSGASWLELPVRTLPDVQLVAPNLYLDVTAPQPVTMTVRGGTDRAGQPYFLAVTQSGHVPGFALPGGILPIDQDAVTRAFAAAIGAPELTGFVGILDAQGSAQAVLDLSGLGSRLSRFVGGRLTLAAWVYQGGGSLMGSPSNPLDVAFR